MWSYPELLTICSLILLQAIAPQAMAVRGGGLAFADMLRGLALLGQAGSVGTPILTYPKVPVYPPTYPWPVIPPYVPPYGGTYPSPGDVPAWSPTDGSAFLEHLQDAWKSDNNDLLLVKDNLARLYLSHNRYQDLYLHADARYLWLRPAGTSGRTVRYAYRVHGDRIELYDQRGNSLILRRYQPRTRTQHDKPWPRSVERI